MPEPAAQQLASPREAAALVGRMRSARRRLARRPRRELASILSKVADVWLAPDSAWMRRAVDGLAADGLFSRPMLELGLPGMIEPLAGDALPRLVQRELGGWQALEGLATPQLILHVLPSNLPAHAAVPSALTLLLGAAALLKAGRDDRVFAPLWVESVRSVDAELGACVEAVYWPGGGDAAIADAAIAGADLVVAAGGGAAMAELGRRCAAAETRFIGHGNRISLAIVGRGVGARGAAAALADDVAMWDQLGCLSPHLCFVEGDVASARGLAAELCNELTARAAALPPGRMTTGEILDVRRFREGAEWRGFAAGEKSLFRVGGDQELGGGSIAVEEEVVLLPTPQHRCVRVVPIAAARELRPLLEANRSLVEAIGVAATDFAETKALLSGFGSHHVVPLGEMQRPDLGWRQSDRSRIADWCEGARVALACP